MADTIERLYKLTVDGTQAARSLGQIEQSAASMDKRMADSIKGIEKFGKSLAAAVSVGAIVNGFKQVIDSMDQLVKDSQKIGITAEELQKLRYAADLSGVAAEQLDAALGKLAVNMSKLGDEGNDAGAALKKMGVESGDTALGALKKISDQVAKMPDGMEKLALVTQQFGKAAGPDMIPLLNAGGQALEDLANEADRYGGVLSGSVIAQAEAFNDNLSRLQRTATGATAQLTAGMLPALRAFSQSLVDATQKGDGFVSTGEQIGELLLNVYGFALKAVSTLQAFGLVLAAVAAAATNPSQAGTIFSSMVDDINALEKSTNTTLANLRTNLAKFKAEAAAPSKGPSGPQGESAAVAADKLAASTKAAAKAADEHRKAEEARWKELIRVAGVEEEIQKSRDAAQAQRIAQLTAYQQAIVDVDKAASDHLDTIEKEGARLQYLVDLTDESSDVYAHATEGQKAYARAQLAIAGTTATATETLVKQRDEVDVLTDGFNDFFKNLASGTADVEQLFKRMVQSIIAELLKLWAKKYIVDAIFGAATGGAKSGPSAGPQMLSASSDPMAGPTGFSSSTAVGADLSPVRFGVGGVPGVPTQQASAPTMQVTINNNAPNTQVDTRQTPAGLEVIISQVKSSLTADVLRGGNDYANAHERAWGLSRGNSAAF